VSEDPDPSSVAVLTDLRRDLADALSRLSADQRIAVVLRDSFGLSYKEISRVARMPVGTAKCYVHRARAHLRTLLEEYTPA
jgi:RNA polymerase sigma-70 factor (ECF subfamily)